MKLYYMHTHTHTPFQFSNERSSQVSPVSYLNASTGTDSNDNMYEKVDLIEATTIQSSSGSDQVKIDKKVELCNCSSI